MKTSHDPRHLKRIKLVQNLFAWDFQKDKKTPKEIEEVTQQIEIIDREIEGAAEKWPIKQINRIDLAILRLAIFELIIKKDAPYRAVVDEAVEIGKELGSNSSPEFINGVLGKIITTHDLGKKGK